MRNFIYLAVLAFFSFLIFSCNKKDSFNRELENKTIDIKSSILQLGFDTTNLKIVGDNIFVEEDIVLKKSHLFKTTPRQAVVEPNGPIGTWMRYTLKPFKYYISNSITNHRPIVDAVDEFRRIFTSIAPPTRVYNETEADLVIRGYHEFSNVCGYASWPTFEGFYDRFLIVGESININLYLWSNLNNSQRKFLIAHELGHAIGIRHTNWRQSINDPEFFTEPNGITYGAYTVPNTNNTSLNPDPNSVFNSGTCGRSWGGFTFDDERAIFYIVSGLTI